MFTAAHLRPLEGQSHLPRDRRHGVFEQRQHARKSGPDGQPRKHPHDAALRPARKGRDAGRGEARGDLNNDAAQGSSARSGNNVFHQHGQVALIGGRGHEAKTTVKCGSRVVFGVNGQCTHADNIGNLQSPAQRIQQQPRADAATLPFTMHSKAREHEQRNPMMRHPFGCSRRRIGMLNVTGDDGVEAGDSSTAHADMRLEPRCSPDTGSWRPFPKPVYPPVGDRRPGPLDLSIPRRGARERGVSAGQSQLPRVIRPAGSTPGCWLSRQQPVTLR